MKRERYCLSVAVFILLRNGNQRCMFKRTGTGWMDGFYSLLAGGLRKVKQRPPPQRVRPHTTIPYVRQAIDNILISRAYSEYRW